MDNTEKIPAPSAKDLQTAETAWVYPNGVVMLSHVKRDRDAGKVEWYTLWKMPKKWSLEGQGFLFRKSCLQMIWKLDYGSVRWISNNASDATKSRGITVQTLAFCCKSYELDFHLLPDLLSTDISANYGPTLPLDYDKAMEDGHVNHQYIANSPNRHFYI